MTTDEIIEHYHRITDKLIAKRLTVTTMESCTGGLIGVLLSDREGASAVIPGGYFTYSNERKIECGVPAEIIDTYGVYSEQTAVAMAKACRENLDCDFGIGITGSIGTVDPNNPDSVPGKVHYAVSYPSGSAHRELNLPEDASRQEARWIIAVAVADMLESLID